MMRLNGYGVICGYDDGTIRPDSYVNVTEFDYEFIGEHADILQVTVTVDFLEDISKKQEAALMREFRMKG